MEQSAVLRVRSTDHESASTIGLGVSHPPDARLLADFLRLSGHAVSTINLPQFPAEDAAGLSMVIVDEPVARRHSAELIALKQRTGPLLPLLVLLPQNAESAFWLRLGFDDVLRLPLTKAELTARLVVLLRLRRQSQEQEALRDDLERRVLERTAELQAEIIERRAAQQSLSDLSSRLVQLQDEERRHIGRELHDRTGQNLAGVAMNLAMVQQLGKRFTVQIRRALAESMALTQQSVREIRTISYLLHPPLLDEAGLESAAAWYADGFARRSGIQVEVNVVPDIGRLPQEIELTLFRVLQECLTNVHRHSASPSVRIQIARLPAAITLAVADRGHGMPLPHEGQTHLGVGILGMRERLRQLGGELEIVSDDQGTTVTAVVPLPSGAP